jgi:beta-galactosidase
VRLGGYPGALRDLLGLRVEEFFPLADGDSVPLSNGTHGTLLAGARGATWTELMTVTGAEVLASYAAGPLAGHPAVTRHEVGQGSAWYLSTELDDAAHDQLIAAALTAAGLTPEVPGLPAGVEAVRRRAAGGRTWLFLLNHTTGPATVPADGVNLLTGAETAGSVELPSGGVAVVREREADFRDQPLGAAIATADG